MLFELHIFAHFIVQYAYLNLMQTQDTLIREPGLRISFGTQLDRFVVDDCSTCYKNQILTTRMPAWFLQYSTENRNQINGKINGLTFPHIISLRHVRVGDGTDLLQLSDKLNLEGTKTPGNGILNFIGHFHTISSLYLRVYTIKILCIKLFCIFTNRRNVGYAVLYTSVTHSRLNCIV